MGVAMGPRGARRPWAEGASASDPALGLSGADWSGGFSSGGSGGRGPSLGFIPAGAGTRQYLPQNQLLPQHPPNDQHSHQHQQPHKPNNHPLQQREKPKPSPLLPRGPRVRRCYTQPLGPAATSQGFQRAPQPLPGAARQAQAPHLPPRSDPTSLQVQRLQLTARQESQSRLPGRGRIGRRAGFEEGAQGLRKGGAWAWLLQHQWCIPTRGNPGNNQDHNQGNTQGSNQGSNRGSSDSSRKPTPSRGPQQQAAPDPSRVSPGQRASQRTRTPDRSQAPARQRSLSSPSSGQAQPRGQATSAPPLRSKHPMSGPVAAPSGAGSCRTALGPGHFLGRGAARKLAQDSPGMGSSGAAELNVTMEDRDSSSVPVSVSSSAGGGASSRGTDGGGRGCSSGEDTVSLCSLNSSTTSLSTSSSGSARGGLRGTTSEPKDSPTLPHRAPDVSPAPRVASRPQPGPIITVPLHENSGEVESVEDRVEAAASEASPGSERGTHSEEKGSPVSDLPLPPGRQGRAAPSRVRSGHPSMGLWIQVPQRGEALMEEEAWRGRAQRKEPAPCHRPQPQGAGESGAPAFKKSWSGPLAPMTANGLRPDLPSRGGNRFSTHGGSPTKDPRDAAWDACAAAVPARPPRIPPPLPRFPGLPAPRIGNAVPVCVSPTLGALGRAASCSASSLEAASPAAGLTPELPQEGPEGGQCLRRSQSVQRDPAEPKNGAPEGAEARGWRTLSTARRKGEGPADTVWRWKNLQVKAQRMGWTGAGPAERGNNNDKAAATNGAMRPACSPGPSSRRRSGGERNVSAGPGLRAGSRGRQWQQGPKESPVPESPSEAQAAGGVEAWDDLRIPEGSEEGDGSSQGEGEEGKEEEVDFSAIFSQKRADRKQGRPVGIVPAFGRPLSQPQPQPQAQEDPQGQPGASEGPEGGSQPQGKELQTPGYLTYTEHVRGRGAPEQQGAARPGLETGRGIGSGAPGSLEGGARPPLEMGQALRSRQGEGYRPRALGSQTPQVTDPTGEGHRPRALGAAGTPRGGRQESLRPPLHPSAKPARGTGAGAKHDSAAAGAAAAPASAAGREGEAKAGPAEKAPLAHALTAASPRTLKLRTISQHIQPSSPLFNRAAQSSAYIQVQRSSSATSSSATSSSRPAQAPAARARAPLPLSRPPLPGSRPKPRPWEGHGEQEKEKQQLALRAGRAAPPRGVPGAAAWGDLPALGLGLQALVRRATGERERGREAHEGPCKGGSHRAGRAARGESGAAGAPAPEEHGDESAVPGMVSPEDHPDYSLLFSQAREERRKGRVSPILPCALQPGKGTPEEAPSPFSRQPST